jgi:hypothetical protein
MSTITDWGEAFLTAVSQALSKFFGFLPDLIGALLILWIGWIIASALGKLVAGLLHKVRFNEATDKAGLSRFIQSAGIRKDASSIMGDIVKWFFRIIALVAAFSVLQLPALTAALTGILDFIPNLAIALVIILIGGLIANFAAEFVKGAAGSAGFSNSGLLSNIARYAILYVAVIAALGQIGIASTVINTIFIGTVAALALAAGLAFGLGGRDTAGRIWENTYNSAQQNLPRLKNGMKVHAQQVKQQAQQEIAQQQAQRNRQAYYPPTNQAAVGSSNYPYPTTPSDYGTGNLPASSGYAAGGGAPTSGYNAGNPSTGNGYPTGNPPAPNGYPAGNPPASGYSADYPPPASGYGSDYPPRQ